MWPLRKSGASPYEAAGRTRPDAFELEHQPVVPEREEEDLADLLPHTVEGNLSDRERREEEASRPVTGEEEFRVWAEGALEEARQQMGTMNPERLEEAGPEEEPEIEIRGLPNIGPDGRFLLWSEEDPDGEIHPVLQAGAERVDPRKPLHQSLFTTLARFSPFHTRAWLGEYRYGQDNAVETPVVPGEPAFQIPAYVKVHGVEYVFEKILGKGAMAAAFLYVSSRGEPIVMKVMAVEETSKRELRALEEAAAFAVANPEKTNGEPTSPLSRALRRADGGGGDLASERLVEFIDGVYLRPEESSVKPAVAIFMEYLPKGDLRRTILDLRPNTVREGPYRKYLELLIGATDDAIDIAEGLVGIHALGIEHRDLKPANMLRGEDGRLKLADFGIARGETPRALRAIDARLKNIHDNIVNDAEGLYTLVVTLGKGFVLPGEMQMSDLLSYDDQMEIWNWLRDWQRYTYEAISAKERKKQLEDLVERLRAPGGLIARFRGRLMDVPELDANTRRNRWMPSSWEAEDLKALRDLKIEEEVGLDITSSADGTITSIGRGEMWAQLGEEADLTDPGHTLGSPRYIPPEHVADAPRTAYRGDVFSFGIALLERTGMGEISIEGGIYAMLSRRVDPETRGITWHADVVPKDIREKVSAASQRARDMGEELWRIEKAEYEELLKHPGIPRLYGALKWATMFRPGHRPAAAALKKIFDQVRVDLGTELMRLEALEDAETEVA